MSDKEPWKSTDGKAVWKTEAQYWNWVRGAMRRMWSDYPLRKQWKRTSLRPLTQEERLSGKFHPSTKNVGECVHCRELMAGSKLECDHKLASQGCTSKSTAESFLWHCVGLVGEDFQLVCKPCHKVKSYADSKGISFEDAKVEKQAIEWEKKNKGIQNQRNVLKSLGVKGTDKLKAKEIRQAYIEYLKENSDV